MGGLGDNMTSGISTSSVRMRLSFGQTWLSNEEQRRIMHLSDEAARWQCNITLLFPIRNFIKTLTCLLTFRCVCASLFRLGIYKQAVKQYIIYLIIIPGL